MTVSAPSSLVYSAAGNGSTTVFPYTLAPFYATSDLVVVIRTTSGDTVKTLGTHYTVSGGNGSTGSVTFGTAPATGETVIIYRKTATTQTVDMEDSQRNPVQALETQLDRTVMMVQERAVLPPPKADNLLGWNAAGTALENKDTVGQSVAAAEAARAAAESAAVAAVAAVNAGYKFETQADFEAATVPLVVQFVELSGYYSAGDAGGHQKKRISTPSPAKAWHSQSDDGAWWEIAENKVTPQMFGAKADFDWDTALGTDDSDAIQAAMSYGKAVRVPFGQYRVTEEIEIVTPGQVIEFENSGGYAYGEDIGENWQHNTAFVGTGTFTPRVRTRRNFRGSSGDAQDAALSVLLNIQAEGVTLIRPCVRLYCDYSDASPSNLGDDCDVGIFVGCRVGVSIKDPIVSDYFRVAGIYYDITNGTDLPRFEDKDGNPYPDGTVLNGSDGCLLFNPYIRGPRIGLAILGAKPKTGEADYTDDYYDEILGTTVVDRRGSFGFSDFACFGGRIYGPDHHSNRRLADPTLSSGSLNETSLNAEPDNMPAAVYIDGLAGNSSASIWGMSFFQVRAATFEAFRVRLGRCSRIRWIGGHIEGRSGGRMDTAGNVINTNDYALHSYGDISGVSSTGSAMWIGSDAQSYTDGLNHFYGSSLRLDTDTGRLFVPEYMHSDNEFDIRGNGHRWRTSAAATLMTLDTNGNLASTGGFVFPSVTAANIASSAHSINTSGKIVGKAVWDSTNGRIMVANGSSPTSTWRVCDGSASVTPS